MPKWFSDYLKVLRTVAFIACSASLMIGAVLLPFYIAFEVLGYRPGFFELMAIVCAVYLFGFVPLIMWAVEKGWLQRYSDFFFGP